VDLLGKYQSLEGIYEHLDEVTPKMRDILVAQKDNAFLSKQLATIVTDLQISLAEDVSFS
jgi:DNA polymerase-1